MFKTKFKEEINLAVKNLQNKCDNKHGWTGLNGMYRFSWLQWLTPIKDKQKKRRKTSK